MAGEEVPQKGRCLILTQPAQHLRPVVEAAVSHDVPQRPHGSCFGVVSAVDQPLHPRQHDRPRTHGARLQRDHEGAGVQPPGPKSLAGRAQREHLCVGGRVARCLASVVGTSDYRALGVEHESADRDVAGPQGLSGLEQSLAHQRVGPVGVHATILPDTPTPRPDAARLRPVQLHVVDHPLVAHKLTKLRDEATPSPTFRQLTEELVTLLAYEATRHVRVTPATIQTPVAAAQGVHLADPLPLVVPILRAGLGMLEGMTRLVPTAEVGFLGLVRDETTLAATTYAERLPDDLTGRQCYVLDPMLATGGTLASAIHYLAGRQAAEVTAVCLLAAPEGLERLEQETDEIGIPLTVVTASVDERLNDVGYIVPGLGDAGDRLYGAAGT